jgi:hypothetical protein
MNLQIVRRRLILLGTPLTLGLLEIWHPVPVPGTRYETIARYNDWWLILHILQLPLFGLMALAVVMLVTGIYGWAATKHARPRVRQTTRRLQDKDMT